MMKPKDCMDCPDDEEEEEEDAVEVVAEDSSDVDEDLFQDYLMTTDVDPYMEYNGSQIHKSN